ncbi:hypothetical protein [Actinomadura sp. 3N508]|uniref:hypothetical protein n=1 Tax=Actinomadura sp. 3N508 TaxID=3375153 RepID=UPI0037BAC7D1
MKTAADIRPARLLMASTGMESMNVSEEVNAPEHTDSRQPTPEELALEAAAARIVARVSRTHERDVDGSAADGVAAFTSFI